MTCNTAIDFGGHDDQEEWTPYIAFPVYNAKETFLACPMKPFTDKIPWKNSFYSPPNELRSVFKNHLLSKSESLCYNGTNNEQLTEKSSLNKITTGCHAREKTREVWNKLKNSCETKRITHWQDSLENNIFLQTMGVFKKPTNYDLDKVSGWNLQRCTCKNYREKGSGEEMSEVSEEVMESSDECGSSCMCPKYFISKSGLVFGSREEKQSFDEKMDKMDNVFKSELETIKEQHERLRETFIPKQDNEQN